MTTIVKQKIYDYLALTKPKIMLLVIFSGITAAIMEGSLVHTPFAFLLAIFALYLTGGSANAFNHYFERHKDAKMVRTRDKRPLPAGRLRPSHALCFALMIGTVGIAIFGFFYNWLSALLSFLTLFFYAIIYTLVLKPNTHHNTVIGGVAGAMAPVGIWAAASGSFNITPWPLFLIIFFWSPAHFWTLAISYKEDYKAAHFKMLPVTKGEIITLQHIWLFSILLFIVSLTPVLFESGLLYLIIAIVFGIAFIIKTWTARRLAYAKNIRSVFQYSIFYLFVLLTGLIIDSFVNISIDI
ncbi:protoheme IX farnesyltransferase [candidate division KSB1 bacterium]|nr:protoheme IX farnesyltransferase [candidate division KSB1 bacterium]